MMKQLSSPTCHTDNSSVRLAFGFTETSPLVAFCWWERMWKLSLWQTKQYNYISWHWSNTCGEPMMSTLSFSCAASVMQENFIVLRQFTWSILWLNYWRWECVCSVFRSDKKHNSKSDSTQLKGCEHLRQQARTFTEVPVLSNEMRFWNGAQRWHKGCSQSAVRFHRKAPRRSLKQLIHTKCAPQIHISNQLRVIQMQAIHYRWM